MIASRGTKGVVFLAALLAVVALSWPMLFGESREPVVIDHHVADVIPPRTEIVPSKLTLEELPEEVHTAALEPQHSPVAEEAQLENPLQQNMMRLVEVDYIREGVRSFIDKHGMENLNLSQKIALGKTLQMCGLAPIMNEDAYALQKVERELQGQDYSERERICAGVTEDEVYASYELLGEAAETGDIEAIIQFADALTPESLRAGMYDQLADFDEADSKAAAAKYAPRLNALLDKAVEQGSVRAAQQIARRYNTGIGREKDPVKAVAYYKAADYVLGQDGYQAYTEFLSSKLFLHEIETADREAAAIIQQWEEVGNLVY